MYTFLNSNKAAPLQESLWIIFKLSLKQGTPRYLIDVLGKYRYKLSKSNFNEKKIKEIFKEIYKTNYWKNSETVSGPGSTLQCASTLIPELTKLFSIYDIHSLIDVPCGDFNWMQKADLQSIHYLGMDIVDEIILANTQKFESKNIKFKMADITTDPLPAADLVFCRDCLVHFSYHEIDKTLVNIKKSGTRYLMTTSFQVPVLNYDIHTGDWRPINLERPPFNFPPPLYLINDSSPEYLIKNNLKKILGLWKIADL